MQMLQQFLGEQGARYAAFLLTAIALLIAILVIWVLIRKALGSRLNLSDKPDRRGRPPRLGITESFNVDRDGRRLVIVRRDNFEHLVMIGGPNDVVIETNIVRGERLTAGRTDQRNTDSELIAPIARAALEAPKTQPVITQPIVAAPKPILRQPVASPIAPLAQSLPPVISQKPVSSLNPAENRGAELKPLLPTLPEGILKSEPIQRAAPMASTTPVAVEALQPHKTSKLKLTLAERIKSGLSFGPKNSKAIVPDAPLAASGLPKTEPTRHVLDETAKALNGEAGRGLFRSEIQRVTPAETAAMPKLATPTLATPTLATPKPIMPDFEAEVAKLKEAAKASLPIQAPLSSQASVAVQSGFEPSSFKNPVVAKASQVNHDMIETGPVLQIPTPVIQAPVIQAPVVQPSISTRSLSKNPFDSLEDEMAKLLGRAPESKG